MARPKNMWSAEEEAALVAGVNKYGVGKWMHILKDQQFRHRLANRSNIDLKDKWRNCKASNNVVLPQNSKYKPCSRTTMGGSRRLWHIVIITAILIMCGLAIKTQTRWKMALRLTVLNLVWPHILKTWRELKRFQQRVRQIYKWLNKVNKHVLKS